MFESPQIAARSVPRDLLARGAGSPMIDSPEMAERAAEILKAIAHPVRLRIVAVLVDQEMHVGALAEKLGVKQPIVSQQLKILRMRGLVVATRANGLATYRLNEPHLTDMIGCMHRCLVRRGGL